MQTRQSNSIITLAAVAALVLLLVGCATPPIDRAPVVLRATGDPGVTVRVTSTIAGVPEQVATVPAELTFHGGSFDLNCMHGPQPGRLALAASRGGISISTGDTMRPGQITQFQIRRNSIAVGAPSNPATR